MQKKKDKEYLKLYQREYFARTPLANPFHCHNSERVKKGFHKISFEEYLAYRKHFGLDSFGKIKSYRDSNILIWEDHKRTNNLQFPEWKRKDMKRKRLIQ